jgi:ubiquinone biosynthesis protein UbiJ
MQVLKTAIITTSPVVSLQSTAASSIEPDIMTLRDASYQVLESLLNQYLSLDPEIAIKLSSLHGKVIAIELSGTGATLFFIPDQNGRLQLLSQFEGDADCTISGTPLNLLRNTLTDSTDSTFTGDILIQGNSSLAQEFTQTLKRIDVDWEEQLSRLTGDIIAHQAGTTFRNSSSWVKRNLNSSGLNLQEYLQEELRLLPGELELDNFYRDVDTLREDMDRLSARIQRLKNKQD